MAGADSPGEPKPRVRSAARAIALLQAIAAHGGGGIGATELARDLGLSRQVVYHLLHTLSALQMVRKTNGNRYLLGLGVATLAQGFNRQFQAPDFLLPYAREAAEATGETAYAVGWVEGEIVVLASARGGLPVQAAEIPRGFAGDAHARASGKLLLAMSPADQVDAYLQRHPRTRRTAHTVASRSGLKTQFAEIREQGFAMDREEFAEGLSCLAVPIGRMPAAFALGISAPTDRLTERQAAYLHSLRGVVAAHEGLSK